MIIDWSKILSESPIDWLLEMSNPLVRYFTLRDILARPDKDSEVLEAKRLVPNSAIVQKILQKQDTQGYWENPGSPYLPKYKSSYWTIMLLGRLGMDKTSEQVAKACEYIFQFQLDEGGFTCETSWTATKEYENPLQKRGKNTCVKEDFVTRLIFENQLSCLTGNVVAVLLKMGYSNDSRVWRSIDWLVRIQNRDGG